MNDHDLLVELATDMKWLKTAMATHLKRHWVFSLSIATAVIGFIITLIVSLF